MDEMTRGKVQLQRITDDKSRQAMFARRKQGLIKKAMELSVLCDCDIGVIIFGPGSSGPGSGGQRLYQYSSTNMDELLERYATAVCEPHERRRNGELLRHYYELSPDEDEEGPDGQDLGRDGDGGVSTSAAAAVAATMAAVDSVILGGGRRQDVAASVSKRMRTQNSGLGGVAPALGGGGLPPTLVGLSVGTSTAAAATAGGPMASGAGLMAGSSGLPHGLGLPGATPPAAATPLRRVAMVGAGGQGPALPLEGIKAAGFLDKRRHPVSPRSERAYEEVTAAFDRLTELRSQRAGGPGGQNPTTVLQPLSSSSLAAAGGTFSLAAQQQHLQQLLQRQQQQQQQLQQHNHHQQQQSQAGQPQQGSGAKRFKPLSILVPEIQTHPIIPTSNHLTPLSSNATPGSAPSASAAGAAAGAATASPPGQKSQLQAGGGAAGTAVGNGLHPAASQQPSHHTSSPFNISFASQQPHAQHQHIQPQQSSQQQHQQQGGLPPRPPTGRNPPRAQASSGALGIPPPSQLTGSGSRAALGTSSAISPVSAVATSSGAPVGAMDAIAGGVAASGGSFAFDRRSMGAEDALAPLLGGPSGFRTSLDGSAANLLSMPSPPPQGGAASLFGSLDGGPLSMRSSSSQGMLAALGLERGASLGLGGSLSMGLGMGLESPGGPMGQMDAALRGLAPMDVLDWPSASPRSSAGNGGSDSGGGGFPDEAEGDGGTILDGLVVRGTALSKLAPEALEAAIGSSPDVSGGGTPVSARAGARPGGHGGSSTTVFANIAAAAATLQGAGAGGQGGQEQQQPVRRSGGGGVGGDAGPQGVTAGPRSGQQSPEDGGGGGVQQTHSPPQQQRQDSLAMFMGSPDGLVTELSFTNFTAPEAAAAALAAAQQQLERKAQQQQQQQQQQQGQVTERGPEPASEQEAGAPDLLVVGRALEIPAGLRTASTSGGASPGAAGGEGPGAEVGSVAAAALEASASGGGTTPA